MVINKFFRQLTSIIMTCLFSLFIITTAFANDLVINPPQAVSVSTGNKADIGTLANEITTGPMEVLRHFIDDVCYLVGIVLLIVSFNLYIRHRRNWQEIPLGTPIFYAILGICVLLLPLLYRLVQS